MTLRTECAWCGLVLEEGDQPEPVSHSICERCEPVLYPDKAPA